MPASEASQESAASADASAPPAMDRLKYAVRTALSLTLSYLIPMAMGWPQPQTAAITVMLIAATGAVSESLQKGVLRVLGTAAGAVIGLTLVALFPQERMLYLLAVSVTVAIILYLYNAYRGDSTLFMLAAVVTLMVFNGGDAEGAFLYGVDRAFMTAFGVIVYTAVASLLWPVRVADNTHLLAGDVAARLRAATEQLLDSPGSTVQNDERLAALLASQKAFHDHFHAVKQSADGVASYRAEWNAIVGCYQELESILLPALRPPADPDIRFRDHLGNYEEILTRVSELLAWVEGAWRGQREKADLEALRVTILPEALSGKTHLEVAALAARAELLQKVQALLLELISAMDSLLFDRSGFRPGREPVSKPAFLWFDRENLVTALRAFITFWIATAIWVECNPPGGFIFVTLCTVLIPLVSYTPVTPKLLFILFTLGFVFALPAYVFLLPQMSHWLQLGVFLFAYAFFGFVVFKGPVSIFFLLGLFTLGIQNTMSYNFNAILLLVVMFYLMCALLIVSTHFPFTSRAELLYIRLHRRFFRLCARTLASRPETGRLASLRRRTREATRAATMAKMHRFAAMIDTGHFPDVSGEELADLNRACDLLHGQLQVLGHRGREFAGNTLVASARNGPGPPSLARLCDALAATNDPEAVEYEFSRARTTRAGVGDQLDEFLGAQRAELHELVEFYVYLNLQVALARSIEACREAQGAVNWPQLRQSRF